MEHCVSCQKEIDRLKDRIAELEEEVAGDSRHWNETHEQLMAAVNMNAQCNSTAFKARMQLRNANYVTAELQRAINGILNWKPLDIE